MDTPAEQSTPRTNTRNTRVHPTNHDEWLKSTFISMPGNTISVETYLNTITRWWQDEHIEFALDTVRQGFAPSLNDVTFVTRGEAEILYRIGGGNRDFVDPAPSEAMPNPGQLPLHQVHTRIYDSLRKNRFVVIAVSDAFGSYGDIRLDPETGERLYADERPHDAALGLGVHWSLLVIDQESKRASLVDGVVKPYQPDGNEWWPKQDSIARSAKFARRTLTGFDMLVNQSRKTTFKRDILLWTPHQHNDNQNKGDLGACRPYICHFLEYLMGNKTLLTGNGVLKEAFDQELSTTRKQEIAFDSMATRQKLRNKMWEYRIRFEAENRREGRYQRLNLTDEVRQDFLDVSGVSSIPAGFNDPEEFQRFAERYASCKHAPQPQDNSGSPALSASIPDLIPDTPNHDPTSLPSDLDLLTQAGFDSPTIIEDQKEALREIQRKIWKEEYALKKAECSMDISEDQYLEIQEQCAAEQASKAENAERPTTEGNITIGLETTTPHVEVAPVGPSEDVQPVAPPAAVPSGPSYQPPTTEEIWDIMHPKPADVHYEKTVNFTHLPRFEIDRWIAGDTGLGTQVSRNKELWINKAILQKAFGGGFGADVLSTDDIDIWRKNHPDCKGHKDDDEEQARDRLKRSVGAIYAPDRRGKWDSYPRGPPLTLREG